MKNKPSLLFVTVVTFLLAGCASQPMVSSTCKPDEKEVSALTCNEGAERCFICRNGPAGNTKQIMRCQGGAWQEVGLCGNCM
jgi:hypothetical protein